MSTHPLPQHEQTAAPAKTLREQQADLAAEILQILDLGRADLDPLQYDQLRAAIAHYTVTLSEAK